MKHLVNTNLLCTQEFVFVLEHAQSAYDGAKREEQFYLTGGCKMNFLKTFINIISYSQNIHVLMD